MKIMGLDHQKKDYMGQNVIHDNNVRTLVKEINSQKICIIRTIPLIEGQKQYKVILIQVHNLGEAGGVIEQKIKG